LFKEVSATIFCHIMTSETLGIDEKVLQYETFISEVLRQDLQ